MKTAIMGTSGVDILLTSAARRVLDLSVEVKNVESLNITNTFLKHLAKYEKQPGLKLLISRRNRTPLLATLLLEDLLPLLQCKIPSSKP